jgi:predicted NAD/FAD-dependent oxidoreductase
MDDPIDPRIVIVGAGMAGLACATALDRAGQRVVLFDKGRRPGGRMSTRSIATPLGDAWFDYGAQYFTTRDSNFRLCVDRWVKAGIAAPWPAAGEDAFVGVPGMSAPVIAMASELEVSWSTRVMSVSHREGGWLMVFEDGRKSRAETLVIALPAEQARALLTSAAPEFAAYAADIPSEPCWTVMAAFADQLPTLQNCWRGDPILGWAARNGSKPGRSGPESWVLQAAPDWSRAHLEEDPDEVASKLVEALSVCLAAPLPPPIAIRTHRWRYARSGSAEDTLLWNRNLRLGVCGDWLVGPRVEAAWLSGMALAEAIQSSK